MNPNPTSPSRLIAEVDFQSAGYQRGHIRLPFSHDRSRYGHIPIPVSILNRGGGPTLLLLGGNHGDEYEGPVALMKLAQRMEHMRIRGRLIVLPALNLPAVLSGSRTSPIDGGNLNRAFVGARDGSLTEMIAHYVETELFSQADFIFDIHSGGASTSYRPTVFAKPPKDPTKREFYRSVVDAFGAPHILVSDLLGEDRTGAAAAHRQHTLFMSGEFGGHAHCSVDGLKVVEQGIPRLMAALGMLDSKVEAQPLASSRLLRVNGMAHYVFSPCDGIFEPCFTLGDNICAGQLAGRVHNPRKPHDAPAEVRFAADGLAVCIRGLAGVEAGDCLGHLAADTTWN